MTKRARRIKRRPQSRRVVGRPRRRASLRRAERGDLEAKVAAVRKLARQDVALDLIRDYVKIGIALDEELAGRRNASAIRELSNARVALAEQLGITPRARGLAGDVQESVAETLAKATGNARRILREKWQALQEEIRAVGQRDGAKEREKPGSGDRHVE